VLPVFSTIGEPTDGDLPSHQSRKDIAVFGSAGLRAGTYIRGGDRFVKAANETGLIVHDIGDTVQDSKARRIMSMMNVVSHGRLPEVAVRKILLSCALGVLAYQKAYVAKSSVFASYCAFGLAPLLLSENHTDCDGLHAGIEYLSDIESVRCAASELMQVVESATRWYSRHDLGVHVAATLSALNSVTR
jgi:hypothetical protein